MRRFALLLAGVAMLGFAVGCSCLCPGYCGYGSGCGYGGGCGYGACPPSGCSTGCPPATYGAPGTIPSVSPTGFQGAYNAGSYETMQAGIPGAFPVTASQPVSYPQTAMAPVEALPTY